MMVTKKEMIDRVARATGSTKVDAKQMLETVFETVSEALIEDGCAKIPGFGTFQKKFHESRNGVNPSTGEKIQIPGYWTVSYKISKDFKARLQ